MILDSINKKIHKKKIIRSAIKKVAQKSHLYEAKKSFNKIPNENKNINNKIKRSLKNVLRDSYYYNMKY